MAAINLNNQHRIKAYEVENIVAIRMLAPKLKPRHLAPAKMLPEYVLGIRHVIAQMPLAFCSENGLVGLRFHSNTDS